MTQERFFTLTDLITVMPLVFPAQQSSCCKAVRESNQMDWWRKGRMFFSVWRHGQYDVSDLTQPFWLCKELQCRNSVTDTDQHQDTARGRCSQDKDLFCVADFSDVYYVSVKCNSIWLQHVYIWAGIDGIATSLEANYGSICRIFLYLYASKSVCRISLNSNLSDLGIL